MVTVRFFFYRSDYFVRFTRAIFIVFKIFSGAYQILLNCLPLLSSHGHKKVLRSNKPLGMHELRLKITQEVSKKPISKFIKNSSDINMKMIEEAVDLKTLYAGFKTKVFVWIIFLTFMIISFNRNIFL